MEFVQSSYSGATWNFLAKHFDTERERKEANRGQTAIMILTAVFIERSRANRECERAPRVGWLTKSRRVTHRSVLDICTRCEGKWKRGRNFPVINFFLAGDFPETWSSTHRSRQVFSLVTDNTVRRGWTFWGPFRRRIRDKLIIICDIHDIPSSTIEISFVFLSREFESCIYVFSINATMSQTCLSSITYGRGEKETKWKKFQAIQSIYWNQLRTISLWRLLINLDSLQLSYSVQKSWVY